MKESFLQTLQARGLVAQVSFPQELEELFHAERPAGAKALAVYCGFDPTAKSLHIGHLVLLLGLRRAQMAGLQPIILFGGATGLVGDPTGRTDMRPMNTPEQIDAYIANFRKLVDRYFETDVPNAPLYVNNADWISPMSWLRFAREVGVHFTVARLLAAEVNRSRYEEGGLTFMELGYQLLQSYDFLHLYRTHGCVLQMGGNDQWSNILSGADLIRRVDQGKAFALTFPILPGNDGRKIGKTSGNAVWLDPEMTPPYDLFQHFRNWDDKALDLLFRVFTFFTLEEIAGLFHSYRDDINSLKELLAFEVTRMVHGEPAAVAARDAARALFSKDGPRAVGAPTTEVSAAEVDAGLDLLEALVRTGLTSSKGEGRKLIQGNGLTVNGEKVADVQLKLGPAHFLDEHGGCLLRKGKKDFHLLKIS